MTRGKEDKGVLTETQNPDLMGGGGSSKFDGIKNNNKTFCMGEKLQQAKIKTANRANTSDTRQR